MALPKPNKPLLEFTDLERFLRLRKRTELKISEASNEALFCLLTFGKTGVCCRRCQCKKLGYKSSTRQFRCGDCGYLFTAKAGTAFSGSNLTYTQIINGLKFLVDDGYTVTTQKLSSVMNVSYKSALKFRHKINYSLFLHSFKKINGKFELKEKMSGHIQMDASAIQWSTRRPNEYFLVKTETFKNKKASAKEREKRFMSAINMDTNRIVSVVIDRENQSTIQQFAQWIEEGSEIWTDKHKAYGCLKKLGFKHKTVNHSQWYFDNKTGVNTNKVENSFARVKNAKAVFGHFSDKYFQYYLSFFDFQTTYCQLSKSERLQILGEILLREA